jgi:hypothetical protein
MLTLKQAKSFEIRHVNGHDRKKEHWSEPSFEWTLHMGRDLGRVDAVARELSGTWGHNGGARHRPSAVARAGRWHQSSRRSSVASVQLPRAWSARPGKQALLARMFALSNDRLINAPLPVHLQCSWHAAARQVVRRPPWNLQSGGFSVPWARCAHHLRSPTTPWRCKATQKWILGTQNPINWFSHYNTPLYGPYFDRCSKSKNTEVKGLSLGQVARILWTILKPQFSAQTDSWVHYRISQPAGLLTSWE